MLKLTLLLLISATTYAQDIDLDILDKSLITDHSLSSFTKYYGEHRSRYKNIYYFKKDRVNVIAFVDDKNIVYKAELQFFRSKITYQSLKEKLNGFKRHKVVGHSQGRYLIYKDSNESVRFYKNSSLSIDNYEVSWEK